MQKVVIILNALVYNRGSEALVRGLTSAIKDRYPDSYISVISSEYDINRREIEIQGVDRYFCRYGYKSPKSIKRYASVVVERGFKNWSLEGEIQYNHLKPIIREADHVIVIGADNYDATYGMFHKLHSLNIYLRKNVKGKLWLYDCSIDPKHLNRNVLEDMMLFDGISVREKSSLKALKNSTFSKNIYYYPDPAFGMEKEKLQLSIDTDNIIGVNASNLIMSSVYGGIKELILLNYYQVIEYCITTLKCKVILIPHVMKGADLSVLRQIKAMFPNNENIYLIEDENLSAPQLKYIISQCRFLITARTHASIAAYSTGVPTLVIGYSIKSKGIAEDIFGESDRYVLPVDKINEKNTIVNSFKWIIENEYEIKKQLSVVMPEYIAQSREFPELFDKRILAEEDKCCGCYACYNACPKNCISFEMNTHGFKIPVIDEDQCIHCSVCKEVCPLSIEKEKNSGKEQVYYAAYNKDFDILRKSSSGGIFFALSKYVIQDLGGVVYGARVKERFDVVHERAETIEECIQFLGSKYLQSEIGNTYFKCKQDLLSGRTVLFSGTPCQIAGLYAYLNHDYENLYTVGVVCHGVPSRTIFDKFILEKEEEQSSKVMSYKWRDKVNGWGPNHISIVYENGKEEVTASKENPYQKGFLDNLYLRSTCYSCKFAHIPRIEDISLADFWGYSGPLKENNQNRGISLVAVSNSRGSKIFAEISDELLYEVVEEEYATSKSRHLGRKPLYNPKRDIVFKENQFVTFDIIKKRYIKTSLLKRSTLRAIAIARSIKKYRKNTKGQTNRR